MARKNKVKGVNRALGEGNFATGRSDRVPSRTMVMQ